MKNAKLNYLLALSMALLISNVSIAGTKEEFKCKKANGSCIFEARLGKSSTKEFRGYCLHSVLNGMHVRKKANNTTCTAPFYSGSSDSTNSYCSKSCTNWNPTKRDQLEVIVQCDSSGDGGSSGILNPTCKR